MLFFGLLNITHALECDFNPMHAPNGEFEDVPLNIRPFAVSTSPENFWALRQFGEDFSEDVEWFDLGGNGFQMIPVEPLEPNTDYRLLSVEYQDQIFAYLRSGTEVDDVAPTASVSNVERSQSQSDWGDTDRMTFDLVDASEDIQVVRIEMSEDDNFAAPHQAWELVYAYGDGLSSFSVGQGLCDSSASSDILDSHRHVRLTFYDWAGNASDPVLVDAKYEQSLRKRVGCSTSALDATRWLVIPLLGLIRRRRGHASTV